LIFLRTYANTQFYSKSDPIHCHNEFKKERDDWENCGYVEWVWSSDCVLIPMF